MTATAHKFDEQGKAEYAAEVHKRWEAGVLDTDEALELLMILEFVDENGTIPTWITEAWGESGEVIG